MAARVMVARVMVIGDMTKHRDNQADNDAGHAESGDDDSLVWKRLTSGVKAYRPDPRMPDPRMPESRVPGRPKPSPAPRRRKGVAAQPQMTPSAAARPVPPDPVDLRVGEHAGIDKSTRRRFAQGQMEIEARLDLHGATAAQAERRLSGFIDSAVRQGQRCVLVITGKGVEGTGVLRRLVPQWLKSPPLAPFVLAISAARPGDGGDGALYVLLRRRRPRP